MAAMYLILENGVIFEGSSFGIQGEVDGELVFTTGMTGYLETLTDPSYYGQIVVQTFPLIGNYGVIPEDFESDRIGASAYIVKYPCQAPSNFRSEDGLDSFLCRKGIVGLYGIDTRALTKIIRNHGVMNGRITPNKPCLNEVGHGSSLKSETEHIKSYQIQNAVQSVSCAKKNFYPCENGLYTVALLDFGMKRGILRELQKRSCNVLVFPHDSTPEEILSIQPNGIMLSNGPGNPEENQTIIENLKLLLKAEIPLFGICLGHQLMALANGFSTEKLKYGHRGVNQPVKEIQTGKVYITSQNHGYAVRSETIDAAVADEWFINVNDGTCEGIIYKNSSAYSVQFHPEACGGPQDTAFLFDRFIKSMEVSCHATK